MTDPHAANEIDLVDLPASWSHDGEGYPPEAGLDDVDPERVPELDGLSEDRPDGDADEPLRLPEIGSHLEELRRRLIVSLSVFVPLFALGIYLYQDLWRIIIYPLDRAAPHLLRFQALGPSDGLIMAMRIALAFALFLSLPVWLSQIWSFVSPGLVAREKRLLYLSLGSGGVLFCFGAMAAYFMGIPFALEFLLPFNQSLSGWENAFTGRDYVDFVITCCAGFGIAFELPLVMFALGWAGILTPEIIRRWWRAIVLVIVILAAVMTPPDPFTLTLLAVPMLALFVIGYYLVKWTCKEN